MSTIMTRVLTRYMVGHHLAVLGSLLVRTAINIHSNYHSLKISFVPTCNCFGFVYIILHNVLYTM